MKNTPLNHRILPILPATILAILLGPIALKADVQTWWGLGATANWSDPSGNWTNSESAAAVPANGDSLVFANATQPVSTNDLSALSVNSLTFTSGDFDFFGTALTLGSGGITNSSADNIFDLPLILSAPQNFEVDASSLTFNQGIAAGGNALAFTGVGNINLNGSVSGTGSLTMNSSGNLTVTNRQPLTGGIIVNSGTFTVATPGNLDFGGALTPSLITLNTNGTILSTTTHAIGGGTALFINRGTWELNDEDYKQNLTLWDGTIEPGPNPDGTGGQLRAGLDGVAGSWTWFVSNSIAGSIISAPLGTVAAGVNLTLDVARGQAASDLTISGVINGPGNITLTDNGITTFNGNNTQTGNLTINNGRLVLEGQLLSSVINVGNTGIFDLSNYGFSLTTNQLLTGTGTIIGTLYDGNYGVTGSILAPGGLNAAGTLTMGGLSLSGNGLVLDFDLANTNTIGSGVNDLLIVTNFSAYAGVTNTVNISFLNGTPQSGATYTLIEYGNGFSGDPSQFLTASASRYTYVFTNDTSVGAIKVIITGKPGNLVWKGDGVTNNWDISASTNWFNGAPNMDVFLQGDNVAFTDVGSNNPPVNLVGALQPTTVTVNSTKNYVFSGSGKITSGAQLFKSNSGNLTLMTANDFTGGGSLSGSGAVIIGNGGTNVAGIGSGNLTNNTSVTFYENASPTYAGNMSGTGSLTAFVPGGTLSLTGTNTFTGGLTVANGTVQIGNSPTVAGASVTGTITNYSALYFSRTDAFTNQNTITSAGNTREYGNGDLYIRGAGGMTMDGTAPVNIGGSLYVSENLFGQLTINPGANITVGNTMNLGNAGTPSVGNVIQNGGSLTVNGYGTLKIFAIGLWASEVSTYSMFGGTLNLPNATLDVGDDGIGLLNMTNGTVTCNGMSIDNNGNTAAVNGTNSTFTMTGGRLNLGPNGITGNTATNALVPTIILSGGTIAATAPSGWSTAFNLRLTNGTPAIDTSNATVTLSGVLSGNGGLNKLGSGYLNLNATNSYTNVTTVAAGTLQGSGIIAGPVVVQSGANLSAGGTLATGTLTVSNLTMNTGANLIIDASSVTNSSDLIYAKGSLALDNATPVTFNFLGGTPYTGGPYTVVSNLTTRTGNLVLAPSALTRYTAAVNESNPNAIQVTFSGTNAILTWNGAVSTNWNIDTDANWLNNGAADKYFQSDAVVFDNNGLGQPNVNLAATVTPASVTVDATGNYTFSGNPIAGISSLTKSGAGTLTLLNSNAYSGLTTAASGTLQIGNGGTAGSLPSAATVDDYGSVVFDRSDTASFNGVLNGPGTLTQAGSGTLVITATQNHYGGTTINPGSTVQLGNAPLVDVGSLGSSPATNNGTVVFDRASNISVATPYSGGGSFIFNGVGLGGTSGYILNATNTFTGPVSLSAARIQSGAGALSFGSPSSITVNPGSQVYAVATPFSPVYNLPLILAGTGWNDGLGALRIENSGTWAGNITLANNARIGVNNATTNIITGNISGNYELETYGGNASAALVLAPASANSYNALRVSIGTAGAKTIAGNNNAIPNSIPLTMNGGTLQLNGFSKSFSSFLNLSGSSSIQNGSTTNAATVTLAPPLGGSSYNGTFADGATWPLNVTLTQPGSWTLAMLTASPNWTGNFTNNGGIITCGVQNTAFGSQGVVGRNIVGNNGAVFVTTLNNVLNGYDGNVVLNNSTWICNRYISFASVGSIYLANSTITGTNNSDGGYENLQLPATVVVRGNEPSYLLGSGSAPAYDLQPGGTTFDVADATGNGNSDLIIGGSSPTFIHNQANSTTASPLIKIGAGTLELDGANTYTGPTLINAGTLALGPSASLNSPTLTIAAGATLDVSAINGGLTLNNNQVIGGSGTLNGSLNDNGGTLIQVGSVNTAGTFTITTNLSLTGSGNIGFCLTGTPGSGNSLLQVNGALTLSGGSPTPLNFTFLNGSPATGTAYTLIQCNGGINGTAATAFTNAANSRYTATFSQTGNSVMVTFGGGVSNLVWTGNDPLAPATWDESISTNWFDGSGPNVFYDLDTVRFDDTSTNNTVALNSTVSPGSVVVDSTNNYTIAGNGGIAGTVSVTKNNTNTLTLNLANTFTGPVAVNAGTLALAGNSPLGANYNNVTVSNGAAVDFNGDSMNSVNSRDYTFTVGGSGPGGNGALLNSNPNGIFSYANISNLTLTANTVVGGNGGRWDIGNGNAGGIVNGNGYNLTKVGTFQMDFRAQYLTNLPSFTISNGSVFSDAFSFTNPATTNTIINLMPGTSLGIASGLAWNTPLVVSNASIQNSSGSGGAFWLGPVTLSGSNVVANSGGQLFNGVISGPGTMWVNGGTSAIILSNANTYAGGTVISNAPATTSAADATAGSAAVIAANPSALGAGPLVINGLNYPSLTTNTSYFLTNVLRAVEFNFSAAGTVTNSITLPAATINNVSLHVHDSGQVINLTGLITGGFTGMTNWIDVADANGGGIMRYGNPANTFTGTVSLFRGLLAITADGSLGNSANVLRLNSASGLRFDAANINVLHNISLTAATTFNVFGDDNGDGLPDTANNAVISSVISGSSAFSVAGGTNLAGTASGSLTLSGANTYTGAATVLPNTKLIAASVSALGGSGATCTVNGGGTLSLSAGGTYGARSLNLSGPGVSSGGTTVGALENLAGNNVYGGAIALGSPAAIGVTAGSLTLNAASGITGAFPLSKVGPGSLVLSTANTYSGGTLIYNGSLFVDGALAAGSAVNASGGTLAGNGVINAPVTVQAGATLAPGDSAIGRLTINGPLNLSGTTLMPLNAAAGTNSSVAGISTVTYGGSLVVSNLSGTLAAGNKFVLFNAASRNGSFASLTLPALGNGLAWSNSLAIDGSIQVVAVQTVNPTPTNIVFSVSGNTLSLSWPADHTGWRLLVQTNNLAAGVSSNTNDWMTVPGSTSVDQTNLIINPALPTEFYQLVYP